jgi:hypothetical protein
MSPLRAWMRQRGRPGWYSWVVVVMVPVLASMAVLVVSLRINQRAVQQERIAREAAIVTARDASRDTLCEIIILYDDSYKQHPPKPGGGGVALAAAISRARAANHCPPYKGD